MIKNFLVYLVFLVLVTGCGFKADPNFSASRLQSLQNQCSDLYITNSYSLINNNSVSAKQVYKIETKSPLDKDYDKSKSYPVYHSFINNNLVSNLVLNKHIRNKTCKDYYLTNIRYFSK